MALQIGAGATVAIHIVHTICDPLVNPLCEEEAMDLYRHHGNPQVSPEKCREGHASLLQAILAPEREIVMFSENWRAEAVPYLAETIALIRKQTGAAIAILGKNQLFREMPAQLLRRVSAISQINRTAWEQRADNSDLNADLRRIAEATGSAFIDKEHLVCPTRGVCDFERSGSLHYWDKTHWTEAGLHVFGERLFARMVEVGLLKAEP